MVILQEKGAHELLSFVIFRGLNHHCREPANTDVGRVCGGVDAGRSQKVDRVGESQFSVNQFDFGGDRKTVVSMIVVHVMVI